MPIGPSRYRRPVRTNALAGFRPSIHGFRFVNRWPPGPAFEVHARYIRLGIGEVAEGLCGGMCFAVADQFLGGEAVASDAVPPSPGSPLFREIARRQLDSLDLGRVPARFWWAAARVAAGRWSAADQVREWRAIVADVDGGRPATAGLVRAATVNPFGLTANHQVLGFGYEASAREGALRIYDPNHPGDDAVRLTLAVGGGSPAGPGPSAPTVSLAQSTGEPLLALLRLPYPARR